MSNKSLVVLFLGSLFSSVAFAGGTCSKSVEVVAETQRPVRVQQSQGQVKQVDIQASVGTIPTVLVAPQSSQSQDEVQYKCKSCKQQKGSSSFIKALTKYKCNLTQNAKHYICDTCDNNTGCQICRLTQADDPTHQMGYPVLPPAPQYSYPYSGQYQIPSPQYPPVSGYSPAPPVAYNPAPPPVVPTAPVKPAEVSLYVPVCTNVEQQQQSAPLPFEVPVQDQVVQNPAPAKTAWDVQLISSSQVVVPTKSQIQFFIARTNGKKVNLEMSTDEFNQDDTTVATLKQIIFDKEGVEMNLVFNGKQLQDSQVLKNLGLVNGSTITETRRLKGGQLLMASPCNDSDDEDEIPLYDDDGNPFMFDENQ